MIAILCSKNHHQLTPTKSRQFFIKTGPNDAMFAGEHASLKALHDAVPTICPQSYGHGLLADDSGKSFLVTDFLEITSGRRGKAAGDSLARKLAKLHTTPAPVPPGYDKPMFGFPAPTCCGDTEQPNNYNASWADFYAENRLRFIEIISKVKRQRRRTYDTRRSFVQ